MIELEQSDDYKPSEMTEMFSGNLRFGTAGIRAIDGNGPEDLNTNTISRITQALANYLLRSVNKKNKLSVFISYDNRLNSKSFATTAAKVLLGNDITVYMTENLRPTPLCSFGVKHFGTSAGIMITASHNPPEYNGYKVYWKGGLPLYEPHESAITEEIIKVDSLSKIKVSEQIDDIKIIDSSLDDKYIRSTKRYCNSQLNRMYGEDLKIVYSNLHGTGITLAPRLLHSWGFKNVQLVEEQIVTDPSFPNAKIPNPEYDSALKYGIEKLKKEQADILLVNDPDADRLKVVSLQNGKEHIFSGNDIAAIMLYHILDNWKQKSKTPVIKSFVTSAILNRIANQYGFPTIEVPIGFKHISQKILELRNQFAFAAEESLGYLYGNTICDKDGIFSAALLAEISLKAKRQNMTLFDLLKKIYATFGVFCQRVIRIESTDETILNNLCQKEIKSVAGIEVINQKQEIGLLKIWLQDGSSIIIRPSGTEPIIKCYVEVVISRFSSVDSALEEGEKRLGQLSQGIEDLSKVTKNY